MEGVPPWVQSVVQESNGHDFRFITTKEISESDLKQQQNRILIPKNAIGDMQVMLSPEEKTVANLNPNVKVDGGGLGIRVFARNKFRIEEVKFKRWYSTGSCVINGREMRMFRAWSNLEVKDVVGMWGFRDGKDGKVCFAIGKG